MIQVNSGLEYLFGMPNNISVQVILIAAITAVATLSVVVGLDGGIRRISELNLVLAWLPFVGMFIARVSRGRSIREVEGVIAAVLLVAGGLSALQTATIASALPFTDVLDQYERHMHFLTAVR